MFIARLFVIVLFVLGGCRDTSVEESPDTTPPQESQQLQALLDLKPIQNGQNISYIIYAVSEEDTPQLDNTAKKQPTTKAKLYIQKLDTGIVQAAFELNGARIACSLRNMQKDSEVVLNGEIDCKKQFSAKIEQNTIIQPKIIAHNLSEILDQKNISKIAAASTPKSARLEPISVFNLTSYSFLDTIKVHTNNTITLKAVRIDFLCSDEEHTQQWLNNSMANYLLALHIDTPKNCQETKAKFSPLIRAMLTNLQHEIYSMEYNAFSVDFFDESLIQIRKDTFLSTDDKHFTNASEFRLYDHKGKRISLYDTFFLSPTKDDLIQTLRTKHTEFLKNNPGCVPNAPQEFIYDNPKTLHIALNYDSISFVYIPSTLGTYQCGEIQLEFGFYEMKNLIDKNSPIYQLIANAQGPAPHNTALDTLYLECTKCAIATLYTHEQTLLLRKALSDEKFYDKMSYKDLDKSFFAQYDIGIKPAIYNGDYKLLDFNHKYLLNLEALDSASEQGIADAQYILYQEGKPPYCVVDKNSNAEMIKYFGLGDTIEVKILNTTKQIPIDKYLLENNIDMKNNICTKNAKLIRD